MKLGNNPCTWRFLGGIFCFTYFYFFSPIISVPNDVILKKFLLGFYILKVSNVEEREV